MQETSKESSRKEKERRKKATEFYTGEAHPLHSDQKKESNFSNSLNHEIFSPICLTHVTTNMTVSYNRSHSANMSHVDIQFKVV